MQLGGNRLAACDCSAPRVSIRNIDADGGNNNVDHRSPGQQMRDRTPQAIQVRGTRQPVITGLDQLYLDII